MEHAQAPLVTTSDAALADELTRLAAAAGAVITSASTTDAVLRGWTSAPVVLVGADLAATLADLAPPRRPGVQVIAWAPAPPDTYRDALVIGAERVVELPSGAELVAELLTDLGEAGRLDGSVLGVVGGCGGAGATTLACAVGQVAAAHGPTLVVDLDPLGPGCDRVLALDDAPGVRWDSLGSASGRLSGRSLREAVPRRDGLGVLGWPATPAAALDTAAVRETLSAARRGHDTVVLDLPRAGDQVAEAAAGCALVALVVRPTVTGVAAAARWVAALPDPCRVGLVVRGHGAAPDRVAALVGVPVITAMSDQRGLAEALDLGLGPVRSRRGPLVTAARAVFAAATEGSVLA
ncbi:MAG TPA: septum site determining protein [Nocardioides bacterium]|uniref:septum site-determining protein Ssd n=1 Tax=uncultured Nocardioides sp. TaxID=198441 RepID=UPI000ED6D178|nr:septum site-determining protein Ssd [uncultured Nocardioides sp.]HCB06770.1 septum site determining protein [Nocardioides sp.]